MNLPVVYEDQWLIVINKPSGLITIPTPKKEKRTLTGILNEDLNKRGISIRLHPCHRLDRETSGLIIYAKGKSVQKKMMEEFKKRRVKKFYTAYVQGTLPKREGEIRMPIEGQASITRYRVKESRNGFSIVEAIPLTGRTNQIRVHFSSIGHPILGEAKFAFRRDFLIKAKRLCLHAEALEFLHPVTGQLLSLKAALPEDLAGFLKTH